MVSENLNLFPLLKKGKITLSTCFYVFKEGIEESPKALKSALVPRRGNILKLQDKEKIIPCYQTD